MYLFLWSREMQITGVFFFGQMYIIILILYIILRRWKPNKLRINIAEWRSGSVLGPITQSSVDRNHALLNLIHFLIIAHMPICIRNNYFGCCYFKMCIYFCQAERLYANYRCLLFWQIYMIILILYIILENGNLINYGLI